jgi:hypothetical protein
MCTRTLVMLVPVLFGLLFGTLAAVSAQDASLSGVKAAFHRANVRDPTARLDYAADWLEQVPRDLHINFEPSVLLEVIFPQSGHNHEEHSNSRIVSYTSKMYD